MWIVLGILALFLLFLGYRFSPVRVAGTVIAFIVLLLAGPIADLVNSFDTSSSTDTSILKNYEIDYTLGADGALTMDETQTVLFTQSRRGIFRFWDETDNQDSSIEHPVRVVSVERCTTANENSCVTEPYTTYYEDGYYVAKIGVASKSYPAGTTMIYRIRSVTTNAITHVADATNYQWYWNVLPQNDMRIEKAKITAAMPAAPIPPVKCLIGESACTVEQTGDNGLEMTATNISPRTPGSWLVELPPAGLTAQDVGTGTIWENGVTRVVMVLIGVLVGLWLYWEGNRRKEPKPSEAPQFAEPDADFLPAVWTWKEKPTGNAFQAMMLKLQDDGVFQIRPEMSGQTVSQNPSYFDVYRTDQPTPPEMTGADDVVNGLGISYQGQAVRIQKNDKDIGKKVQNITTSLQSDTRRQVMAQGLAVSSPGGMLINFLAAVLAPLALLSVAWNLSAFPAAMFAIASIGGWWSSWTNATNLTEKGLHARDQVNGLRVALGTKASIERYDYSLRARYFMHFLPWAVALNCADEWAEACKPDDPGQMDDPVYHSYWTTYMLANSMSSTISSVSQSAVSSYSASTSSGGGGGGFSAGGGGGGGGGGSW